MHIHPVAFLADHAAGHSVIPRRHCHLDFRFLLIHATSFPRAVESSLAFSLLLVAGISVSVTVSCGEDVGEVGEDEVEELVVKPRTTNGTWFEVSRWIFLAFLMRCGFLATRRMVTIPKFFSERTAGVSPRSITVTNKSISLTYTVASSLVSTSPLAVTTIVGFFDILTVSNSALLRFFLLTICAWLLRNLPQTLFLRGLLWMRPA